MDFAAEEKLINNDSRKMRMRSHSFSLSFFSDNQSNNTKIGKKLTKKVSKKSLQQQQSLNDRIPSLPFQYSRKIATQLNGTERDEDVLITRKSLEWNTRMFKKSNNRIANESDEFGCCGIPDMSIQSPALSIGSNTESPNSVPFEISTPLDHPACMLFKEHDEDSLDMTTLLDHTLIPIMTTSTTSIAVTRTKMQNEKIQSIKNSIPLYSPSHSSASSASYSSSSAVEFDQSRPSQMQRYTNSKAPKPARSLPSLRSTFSRTQSDSVVDISHKPVYQDDENCLGLCLNTKMLGLNENEKTTINLKQRSPLRERRQKPPLHINSTSNPSIPFSAINTDSSLNSTKMTLRMRRSKVGLFSPPPCPPPTTPLPVLPFSPCHDDGINAGKIEQLSGSKEETNKIIAPKRQEKGLSFQSVASIQFSESSFDSYQTFSRSSYETPKRSSKASLYLSAISSTFSPIQTSQMNELKHLEEEKDKSTMSQSIQVEQIDETIQNPNSDVHIIGYAF